MMGMDAEDIAPSSHLMDDLGADSLDHVELMMAMEEEFDFDIPDVDADTLRTVGDLSSYVAMRFKRGLLSPVPSPV